MPKAIWFKLVSIIILLVGLIIRLIPTQNNNFYFTMDQGNDAVAVREILHRGQILLRGPETGIKGFHHGPLWYYFIAPGYALTDGHPFGAVLMLIILNLATVAFLMYKIAQKVNPATAILVGASLQFFWWFYDASRYGFNPFPLVALSILLILFLIDFKTYPPAAVPVGLAFHTETAAAVAFAIFYFSSGVLGIFQKRLKAKTFFLGASILCLFFIPKLISEIQTGFQETKVIAREFKEPSGVFHQTRYRLITKRITPQSTAVGIIVLAIVMTLFTTTKPKNRLTSHFVYLSLALTAISALWFGATTGWQVWHTVYIRPLLFIAVLLMLANIIKAGTKLTKRLTLLLLFAILVSQFLFFALRWHQFAKPTDDPSLLTNELAAVDWVYGESESLGFYVYSYLPSVEDYPYQYLFWWRGTQKYGYVPCEYSTAPGVPDLFVPGQKYYQTPQKTCINLRFLIIEPDTRSNLQKTWLDQTREGTILLKEANFGKIRVEKRQL